MSKSRRFRSPFVVTTAAAVSSISMIACGGSTDGDNGTAGTGGTSGSGGGGTGGQVQTGGNAGTTGGSAGVGATGGVAGSGATGGSAGSGGGSAGSGATGGVGPDGGPICPPTPPGSGFGFMKCPVKGASCKYDVKCQSGTQSFTFNCDSTGFWSVAAQKCSLPYDSCPNTDLYCSSQWMIPQGTNPPAPCPATKPKVGDKCFVGGLGGVWENCGYRCDSSPNSKWTVMSCKYVPNVDSKWESDGACGK